MSVTTAIKLHDALEEEVAIWQCFAPGKHFMACLLKYK